MSKMQNMSSRAPTPCRAPLADLARMAPAGFPGPAPPVEETRMARAEHRHLPKSSRIKDSNLNAEPYGPFLPHELPSGTKWCALLTLANSGEDDDDDDDGDEHDGDYVLDDFVVADEEADKLTLEEYKRQFVENASWLICSKMKSARDSHRLATAKFKKKSASRANANTKRRRASRLKHKLELQNIDEWSKSVLAHKVKNLRGGKKRRGGKKNKKKQTDV